MYEVDYQLTRADLTIYQKLATARLKAEANKAQPIWTKLALWTGLVILFAAGFNIAGQTTTMDPFSVLVGTWIGLLLVTALSMRSVSGLRAAMYSDTGPSLSPQHAVFDETGMHVKTSKMSAVYKWDLFVDISSGNELITLWMEPCLGLAIPARIFKTGEDAAAFVAFARERVSTATSRHTS